MAEIATGALSGSGALTAAPSAAGVISAVGRFLRMLVGRSNVSWVTLWVSFKPQNVKGFPQSQSSLVGVSVDDGGCLKKGGPQ